MIRILALAGTVLLSATAVHAANEKPSKYTAQEWRIIQFMAASHPGLSNDALLQLYHSKGFGR